MLPNRTDEFSESFKEGGRVIFNQKNYIANFGPLYRALNREKMQYKFLKMRRVKVVWNFSKNSSDLVTPFVPYKKEEKIEVVKIFCLAPNCLIPK